MPTEFSVNKRDLQFVLYEQLNMEELFTLPAYKECNRETADMVTGEAIKLAVDVLAPINGPGDREGCHFEKGVVRTPAGFKEAYRQFSEGGWNGMVHDPECGGQGLPNLLRTACAEAFCGSNISFFLTSMLTEGTAHLIEKFGTQELRQIYCQKMYSGEWSGTMCLTETSAGSDVGNLKTVAKRQGDHYLITGNKIFITSAEHDMAPNIIHAVLARVEGAPPGTKGISLFVVPKFLVNKDGSLGESNDVCCGNIEHKMGIKASPTCTMNFGDEGHCKGWLLGKENEGMKLMFQMMNEARLGVGIQGLALASAGYLSALGYAQERTQGSHWSRAKDAAAPRACIVEHPDIRRALLHMKSVTDALRSMVFAVAKYIDMAEHAKDEKDREHYQRLIELLTPICKAYCSDMGFRINEMAVQVYGGYGYCQEYPVEQYCRDQKIASIYEGANGIQAIDLLGRKVVGSGGQNAKEFLGMALALMEKHKVDPQFGPLVKKLSVNIEKLSKVTMALAEALGGKDPALAFLRATPYLEMFGHIICAYYLLDGAVVASGQLKKIYGSAGANDAKAQEKVLCDNSEAAFYHGRIASARFFIHQILPQAEALADTILSGDRSPLEIVFPK